MTTYRLLLTLAFIAALASPSLSNDNRIWVAIGFGTGVITAWQTDRDKATGRNVSQTKAPLLAIAVLVVGGTFALLIGNSIGWIR